MQHPCQCHLCVRHGLVWCRRRLSITCTGSGDYQRCLVRTARHIRWRQHIHACLVCAQRALCVVQDLLIVNSHSTHVSIRRRAVARRPLAWCTLCNMPSCAPIDRTVDVVRYVYCQSVAVAAPSCSIYSTLYERCTQCRRTRTYISPERSQSRVRTDRAVSRLSDSPDAYGHSSCTPVHNRRCVHIRARTLTRTTVATAVTST